MKFTFWQKRKEEWQEQEREKEILRFHTRLERKEERRFGQESKLLLLHWVVGFYLLITQIQ